MPPLPIRRCRRVLEKGGYHYVIRIQANAVLEREFEHLLTRAPRASGLRAGPMCFITLCNISGTSWHPPRRVVATVECHQCELFRREGILVTNLNKRAKNMVKFYNGRGAAEQMSRPEQACAVPA